MRTDKYYFLTLILQKTQGVRYDPSMGTGDLFYYNEVTELHPFQFLKEKTNPGTKLLSWQELTTEEYELYIELNGKKGNL